MPSPFLSTYPKTRQFRSLPFPDLSNPQRLLPAQFLRHSPQVPPVQSHNAFLPCKISSCWTESLLFCAVQLSTHRGHVFITRLYSGGKNDSLYLTLLCAFPSIKLSLFVLHGRHSVDGIKYSNWPGLQGYSHRHLVTWPYAGKSRKTCQYFSC